MQLIHLSLSQEKIFENQDVFSFPILVYFYETNIGILCYIGTAIFLYIGISILHFTTLLKIYARNSNLDFIIMTLVKLPLIFEQYWLKYIPYCI